MDATIHTGRQLVWEASDTTPEEIDVGISGHGEELGERFRAALDRIDAVMAPLSRAEMARPDAALIQREFAWAAAMTKHGCRRGLWGMGEVPNGDLAEEARWLLEEHRAIWHARNRPGGFPDSQARLERMARDYD